MRAYHLLVGASLLALSAQPAFAAAEDPWYFSLKGGVSLAEKSRLDGPLSGLGGHSEHGTGYAFGAALGYDFGGVRLEAELMRHENDVKRFAFDGTGGIVGLGQQPADSGDTTATAAMANLYYDIDLGGATRPFIGFGMGIARLNFDSYRTGAINIVDDSKSVFAYQAIAGIRHAISKAIDLTLEYRYFNTENPKLQDALGRSLKGDYSTHLVLAGLVWKFGGKAAEPVTPPPVRAAEPAPAPVPVPPPPVVAPLPGPYLVYFDFDKSSITPEAARILDEAATAAKNNTPIQIVVKGHTDTSGTNAYNQKLSERRAASVFEELVKRGVTGSAIGTEAVGEEELAIPTADGVREPANRRVSITFSK